MRQFVIDRQHAQVARHGSQDALGERQDKLNQDGRVDDDQGHQPDHQRRIGERQRAVAGDGEGSDRHQFKDGSQDRQGNARKHPLVPAALDRQARAPEQTGREGAGEESGADRQDELEHHLKPAIPPHFVGRLPLEPFDRVGQVGEDAAEGDHLAAQPADALGHEFEHAGTGRLHLFGLGLRLCLKQRPQLGSQPLPSGGIFQGRQQIGDPPRRVFRSTAWAGLPAVSGPPLRAWRRTAIGRRQERC